MSRRRYVTRVVFVSIALAVGTVVAMPPASGEAESGEAGEAADTRRRAVVSLGDSYISGEAGRWSGNAVDSAGDRAGTDRAYVATPTGPSYDPARVYGPTATNGCHRSDVAPITHVRLPPALTINLACSGARTQHVLRASAGGVGFKGEATQNDQLALVARAFRVTSVVLNIGGNDLGFASIVTNCVLAYLTNGTPCRTSQQPLVEQRLPEMAAAVARTIDDIRATMDEAGYANRRYRLLLQSYPAPIARAAEMRYPQADPQRQSAGGCPVLDTDADWSHELVGQISSTLRTVAADKRVQFLDLGRAFGGHELCSNSAEQSDGTPDDATNEWIRWVDLAGQGDLNESVHPNAFGQKALGRCLQLAFFIFWNTSCHGFAGRSSAWMHLRRL